MVVWGRDVVFEWGGAVPQPFSIVFVAVVLRCLGSRDGPVDLVVIFRLGNNRGSAAPRVGGSGFVGLGVGVADPRGEVPPAHALVGAEDDGAAFGGDGAHEREPSVAGVGCGGEVEVDVLGVEGVAGACQG